MQQINLQDAGSKLRMLEGSSRMLGWVGRTELGCLAKTQGVFGSRWHRGILRFMCWWFGF